MPELNGDSIVSIESDPRGESENYTAYSFVWRLAGKVVGTAGIRKNDSGLWPEYQALLDAPPALGAKLPTA